MADFNVYELTSTLTLDTARFDRGIDASHRKIVATQGDLKKLETSAKSAGKSIDVDLGGALSEVSPKLGALTAAGPVGLVIAGLGLLVTAVTAAATGIWSLASIAADAGGQIHDLTQRVNFSAETISGLGAAGKKSGVDLASLNTSLGIFDKNLEKFNEGEKQTVANFKELGITARDNEEALRQAFRALNNLGGGSRQTALAMELFGKSGKEVLALIKETNGDIDAAIEHYRRLGMVIGTEDAEAADAFGDALAQLQGQMSAAARTVGNETLPAFTVFFDDMGKHLAADTDKWYSWGNIISNVTAGALGAFEGMVRGINAAAARIEMGRWYELARLPFDLPGYVAEEGRSLAARAAITSDAQRFAAGMQLPRSMQPGSGFRGGGGGGGGRGGGSAKTDPGVQLLRQLTEEFDRLTPATKTQETAEKLLGKEFAKTSDETKKKIQLMAQDIDLSKMILGITRERVVSEERLGEIRERQMMKELTRLRQIHAMERERMVTRDRPDWIDLGGGSTVGGEPGTTTRPRIATVDEQVKREKLEMYRERMRALASETTYAIDRALYEGFTGGGVKGGLASLGRSMLDIVRNVFLRQLEEGLYNLFSNLDLGGLGGGGGGGKGGGLFNLGLSGLLGIFGGGSIFSGHTGGFAGGPGAGGYVLGGALGGGFAEGGRVRPNTWYLRGERGPELAKSGPMGDTVLSNSQSRLMMAGAGGMTFNVFTKDAASFNSRETQTQIKRKMMRVQQAR